MTTFFTHQKRIQKCEKREERTDSSQTSIATSEKRLPSLDGLRSIAIAIVLLSHVIGSKHFPTLAWIPDGRLGVRIFYVISGFIITLLMVREENRNGRVNLWSFYRRRCVRILPIYWIYLATLSLFGLAGILNLFRADILRPLTFTFTTLPESRSWFTLHTWSLIVEEQFYIIWPIAFILLRTNPGRLIAVSFVLFTTPALRLWIYLHPRKHWMMWTIFGNADMIGWGCFLALFMARNPLTITKIIHWRPLIGRAVAIAIVLGASFYFPRAFRSGPGSGPALSMSAEAIAIAYLIGSLTQIRSGLLFQILNSSLLTFTGTLSYSLYIWQQLFFVPPSAAQSIWLWMSFPMNMICLFVIAICSYYFIERPLFRFKRSMAFS